MKPIAAFANFDALDIRIGKVTAVDTAATKKPTWRLTIDFGPELGTKVSCGAYTNYPKEALLGKQIVAVVNLGEKKMGPEVSQVLVLGAPAASGGTIHLMPEADVAPGAA